MINRKYPPKKRRTRNKVRSDKGEIRATPRDIACILWIAEMYAARSDQIRRLLSRYPDPAHPPQGKLVSESVTREQIARWVRAGWIVYRRVLAAGPGWAYVTKKGLLLVDRDGVFLAKPPSPKRLNHIFAVNQIRLWMDVQQDYSWHSERLLRAELELKRGESSGSIPDGLIFPKGIRTAVEVQISELKPAEWEKKLSALLYNWTSDYQRRYPWIWVYVSTQELKEAGEAAVEELANDEQKRISFVVEDDLLIADAWSEASSRKVVK